MCGKLIDWLRGIFSSPESDAVDLYLSRFYDDEKWQEWFEEPERVAWLVFAEAWLRAACPDALAERYALLCAMLNIATERMATP